MKLARGGEPLLPEVPALRFRAVRRPRAWARREAVHRQPAALSAEGQSFRLPGWSLGVGVEAVAVGDAGAPGSGGSSVASGAWSGERSGGAFDAAAAGAFPDLNRPQKPLLMSSMVAEWLGRVSAWPSRLGVGGALARRVFRSPAGAGPDDREIRVARYRPRCGRVHVGCRQERRQCSQARYQFR